jgi:hypothetical protein
VCPARRKTNNWTIDGMKIESYGGSFNVPAGSYANKKKPVLAGLPNEI